MTSFPGHQSKPTFKEFKIWIRKTEFGKSACHHVYLGTSQPQEVERSVAIGLNKFERLGTLVIGCSFTKQKSPNNLFNIHNTK